MRTRKDILDDLSNDDNDFIRWTKLKQDIVIELLLDIRELIKENTIFSQKIEGATK